MLLPLTKKRPFTFLYHVQLAKRGLLERSRKMVTFSSRPRCCANTRYHFPKPFVKDSIRSFSKRRWPHLTDMVIERGHYVIGHKGPLEALNSWRIPPTSSYQKSAIVKNQICLAEAEVDEKSWDQRLQKLENCKKERDWPVFWNYCRCWGRGLYGGFVRGNPIFHRLSSFGTS